ncbi:MAG: aminotransferase class IV [bacterium]
MYPLFEAICLKNGELLNAFYHNKRILTALKAVYMSSKKYKIDEIIKIPSELNEGTYKCRFMYSDAKYAYEFLPYLPMDVNFIKMETHNNIEYKHKFTERKELDVLREDTKYDDVLIVKRGLITDTTRANIVFNMDNKWVTPDKPMLRGTQREKLLEEGTITKMEIKESDLHRFKSFKVINAMCPFETQPEIPITNIIV